MTDTKFHTAYITKSVTDGSGTFAAILAAFGPPADHQGEYFKAPGTFTESILRWEQRAARGARVPIYLNHATSEPDSKIGELTSMRETPEGYSSSRDS